MSKSFPHTGTAHHPETHVHVPQALYRASFGGPKDWGLGTLHHTPPTLPKLPSLSLTCGAGSPEVALLDYWYKIK